MALRSATAAQHVDHVIVTAGSAFFDVVDAEGSLLAARTSLAQLLAAYQVARLDLDRVTGRLKVDFGARP